MALRHPLPLARSQSRLVAAAVIIGVAIAADVWVARYKILTPEGQQFFHGSGPRLTQATVSRMWPHFFASPAWVAPTAFGIAALGLAAAASVLALRRAAVAALILGATLAGAAGLYGHRVLDHHSPCQASLPPRCIAFVRPGWVGPTALAIALLGSAAAGSALLAARRRTA